MRKAELEAEVARLNMANKILRTSLVGIRQLARDCITKDNNINNVWIIEEVTTSLTKSEAK